MKTTSPNRMAVWLRERRTSTRLGFILQISCRILFSVLSLIWTPLLLNSMGKALNGLFLSFQSVATLGGLGDLGMGGVVNIQTSRLLGQGKHSELHSFLASARALFLVMALVVMAVFFTLTPWLPQWLRFESVSGSGSLTSLFFVGAMSAGLLILSSYITNLNYGCGNLTWAVVPLFVLTQFGILSHWLLARGQFPLWAQYLPYVCVTVLGMLLSWIYVRFSHPSLSEIRQVVFDWKRISSLLGKSFWLYFYYLAAGICMTSDRLLINAGFGADQIPAFVFNYKLCELALFVVVSASLMSMPKITQWMASPDPGERARAVRESERLNKFQTFLGCASAMIYLAVNDTFIKFWLGPDFQVPLSWQVAFAAQLSVSAAGYLGFDLAARTSDKGIRVGGIAVISAALLNFGLSYIAMKRGSILGIAVATVIAQSCLVLVLGRFTFAQLKMSWWHLSFRNWLLALAAVALGFGVKLFIPMDSVAGIALVCGIYVVSLLLTARILKISFQDIFQEIILIRSLFAAKKI